jgi:cell division septum initiation protein DivIVA
VLLGPSTSETPPARPRRRAAPDSGEENDSGSQHYLTPEELVEQAVKAAIAHSEILNKPITLDDAADPEALEATRKEMMSTAKVIANTAAAMLEERQEASELMENFLKREREATKYLEEAKKLRAQWETMMASADKEANRI